MTRFAWIFGLLLGLWTAPAPADDAPLCPILPNQTTWTGSIGKVDTDDDFFDNTGNCCRNVAFKCDAASDISAGIERGGQRALNIVLVIADDQGYCQYGFMAGYCSGGGRDGEDCRSNIDCPSGQCVKRNSNASASAPLRLGDFTCRYRQPPSHKDREPKACKYKGGSGSTEQPDKKGSNGGDKNSHPFHASNFPCTTTYEGGTVPTNPVPLTPYLDQLATHGALFTRAYLGGNACKSSRPVILYGKPHRHLLEMSADEEDDHSIASWLQDDSHALGAPPGTNGYWPFMLGKGEVMSENSGGFLGGKEKAKPKLAKYRCNPTGNSCQDAAEAPLPADTHFLEVPYDARDGGGTYGIGDALNIIEGRRGGANFSDNDVIVRNDLVGSSSTYCEPCRTHGASGTCDATRCGSQLTKPFFLWFAPNQPHKKGYGENYKGLYPTFEERDMQHAGRLTQMDQAVGTLVDELKRHCICGKEIDPESGNFASSGTPQKQSLWEHTVLIYLADHGFFLPDAKRTDTENTHRTVLLVSEPKHRLKKANGQPLLPARPYENDLVSSIDVFRTVLDYANLPFTESDGDPIDPLRTPGYRFARSLKSWVSDATQPTGKIRDVVYGEDADAGEIDDDVVRGHYRYRYLITRPGLLGVCVQADGDPDPTGSITYDFASGYQKAHARPCLIGGSDCPSGSTCEPSRCINDPSKDCSSNADCVDSGFCDEGAGECRYDIDGSLGDTGRPVEPVNDPGDDVGSRSCSADSDCVPSGVSLCQPPIFKIKARGGSTPNTGVLDSAWDLLWDPDERHNLLAEDPSYFGSVSDTNSLHKKVLSCLDNYWKVDATPGGTSQWQGTYSSTGCTWIEPALPAP